MRISDWSSDVCSSDLGVALVCGLMAWEWGSLVADLNGRGLARGVILGVSTLALGWMLLRGPYWGVGVGVAGAVGIVLAGRFMRLPQAPWLAVAVISIVLPGIALLWLRSVPLGLEDRKSVVSGKGVLVRVDLGG